jgi:hypothetical protein
MRAVPSLASMPRLGGLPRLMVSAAAAAAVLHHTKKARGRLNTDKSDYSASATPQGVPSQASKAGARAAAAAATSAVAAARLLPQWGVLLPSLIAVGLSWLGVLYSKLGPIRSWMVAALPALVQVHGGPDPVGQTCTVQQAPQWGRMPQSATAICCFMCKALSV